MLERVIASLDAANDASKNVGCPGFHLRIFRFFFECSIVDLFREL